MRQFCERSSEGASHAIAIFWVIQGHQTASEKGLVRANQGMLTNPRTPPHSCEFHTCMPITKTASVGFLGIISPYPTVLICADTATHVDIMLAYGGVIMPWRRVVVREFQRDTTSGRGQTGN